MANFLMHSWTSRSNRDGRLGISVIQIPDSDSDSDSVASALPDGYYSLNKYSAAVLVNIMLFLHVIADSLVIYRCHAVWNRSKRVIILPCVLLICGSACGYGFIAVSKEEYRFRKLLVAFLFTTVTLNLLVTALMAGRIWWIARKARSILGPGLSVESGVIYSIYVVLDVVFPDGIVPTLIIVQIGLGRNAHDVDTSASMVRTDARATLATTTNEYSYDAPPSGSPPPMSPISLPPVSFSPQTVQRGTRTYESHPDRESDAECGYL
ncbi:hypothetical protein BJ912DRAFT_983454 [Pholiota molesta]|nr:hypothetical protein BJ912DRAFT_983454 [Pholiota molesta]